MTKEQQTSIDQLNAVNAQLTTLILGNTAQPGSAAWNTLQALLARQNLVQSQINAIIAEQFAAVPSAALAGAVAQLQQSTNQLTALGTTLANIDAVLGVVNTIVQAATSVIALAAAV